ncbi:hypothetical protein ACET3X_004476 [Alternaria dauci]|uniref:BTB domain-containing protein n=1 Tax=Alternaria dauci TaxID=48095 RepID=A0ABR3UP91_9PLEO
MTTPIPRSPGQYTPVDAKVWDMIFLDTKTKVNKKKEAAAALASTIKITANDIDIREWSFSDRQMLVKGSRVQIFVGDVLITTISKPLLRATSSTVEEIFKDGAIELPADTDKNGVTRMVKYLEAIIKVTGKPSPFTRALDTATTLGVCDAAHALGMDKYTVHLYKKCEALLRKDPPAYEDFASYLAQNPVLDTAIKTAVQKHSNYLRWMQKGAERNARAQENQARRDAYLQQKAERATKKRADEKTFFAAKAAKEAALGESIQKKIRASEPKERKFTAEENVHYWRMYGKKPPKGC